MLHEINELIALGFLFGIIAAVTRMA